MSNFSQNGRSLRVALMCATALTAALAGAAHAEDTQAAKAADQAATPAAAQVPAAQADSQVVVVTGFRAALRNATTAKKNSTNFTETIFSEDLGKFPDINLAESMQRVPGMVVQRDAMTGEGTQISVRALPSSFTLVTMNGNRVAVASDFGFTGSSSPNRQVDLDMFPTGLFNRVDVNKTPSADALEGGIAGTVNVQNARPLDRKGEHGALAIQDSYNNNARKYSPRITGVWSKTWDKFGVLLGYTQTTKKIYSDGFETVGWGDPNFSNFCGSCDPGAVFPGNGTVTNPAGSNQFRFSNTVYSYTGNGLTPGTLTEAQLLALNPNVTEAQMKGALLPRLGRPYLLEGDTHNKVGLIALEFRPADNLRFHLDILGGGADRSADRSDMMWAVRNTGPGDDYNGGMIPLNMTVDSNDVVTGGTFANSSFFEETNWYRDHTAFASGNLGFEWKLSDTLKWTGEAAFMRSTYERDVTFMKFRTAFQSPLTVTYKNIDGNDMPTITPSVNLNDPAIGWRTFTSNLFMQRDIRTAISKSVHTDLTKEIGNWTVKGGWAYDQYERRIDVYDNSAALRTAFSAAIPDSSLSQFMAPMTTAMFHDGVSGAGFDKFVRPNFDKVSQAIGYNTLIGQKGSVSLGTTYNGAGASHIEEKISAAYMMGANRTTWFGVPVRTNYGLRWQTTEQTITSPSNVNSQIVTITTSHKYHDVLPSFNLVASVTDKLNLRFATSKSMTRANPSDMSSQLGYSDPGAQNASQGNPGLKPYYSKNIDIGGEYYTGKTGYVGVTLFRKTISNYVINRTLVVPFPTLGISYSSLGTTQQSAIAVALSTTVANLQANPALLNSFNVNLSTKINSPDKLRLSGQEFMWVQPLDNLVDGLGYTFNYTHFGFSNINLQTGIPDFTYNFTGYYEHKGFSTRLSYVDVGRMTLGTLPSPNSIPYPWYQQERHQIDLSASYKFKAFGLDQSITLDATNLDNQGFRSYLGFKNVPYAFNNPGTTVILGWRATY